MSPRRHHPPIPVTLILNGSRSQKVCEWEWDRPNNQQEVT